MGERRIVGRGWRGFKWTKGKMGQTWFELRVGSQGLVRLCSTLRGLGEGDDDGKGIRVVDEVNESVANVVVDGGCNVWRKVVAAQ